MAGRGLFVKEVVVIVGAGTGAGEGVGATPIGTGSWWSASLPQYVTIQCTHK